MRTSASPSSGATSARARPRASSSRDELPAGDGLDWAITDSTGTGSECEITGAVGSQVLTCDIGSINGNTPPSPDDVDDNSLNSGSVTVTSGTTSADCGVIDNTGEITSNNDGTNTNAGQYTVLCPDVTVDKTPDGDDIEAGDTADFGITVTQRRPRHRDRRHARRHASRGHRLDARRDQRRTEV